MTRLLAIDPGQHSGFAYFDGGTLGSAKVLSPDDEFTWCAIDIVVIEFPRLYPQGHPRPNNLLTLAATAGRYIERYHHAKVQLVYPRDWKGTIDGDVFCRRIEAALTPAERAMTDALPEGTRHNAIDAIGLGKWALRQPWYKAFR